jgi:hypothetical protein
MRQRHELTAISRTSRAPFQPQTILCGLHNGTIPESGASLTGPWEFTFPVQPPNFPLRDLGVESVLKIP